MSLRHYDPALFELFEHAFQTKKEIKIPFETLREATGFALKMQRLRRDMRLENHHLLIAAETLEVSVDRKTFEVRVRPQGYSYIAKVQAALSRLPEVSDEIKEEIVFENPSLDSNARGPLEGEGKKDQKASPADRPPDGGDKVSPAEEALKAFMKGEKK